MSSSLGSHLVRSSLNFKKRTKKKRGGDIAQGQSVCLACARPFSWAGVKKNWTGSAFSPVAPADTKD